uniref:hypothetical protein n=1 Tax=Psychrosphaera aestuarii TaxID=1266052 RepID=UPI001B31D162|nr:hypothetical protein [Psychrosphaera aestuarii]
MWNGIERRKGPDLFSQIINALNVLSWLVFVIALALFHYARPELNNIILEFHKIPIREYWLGTLKDYLYLSLYISVTFSAVSLIGNQIRNKRKTDYQKYNLMFLMVVLLAFIGVISV